MKDLAEKVAFITGGASGIGFGMATAFGAAGMRLAIADVEEKALESARAALASAGAEVIAIPLDVTDRTAMQAAAQRTEAAFGKVHVVCNNAGVASPGALDEITYEDWDWVLGVNLGGVINGVQTFVRRIKAHGEGGHIVNTASMAGLVGARAGDVGTYRTAKFAVVALTENLRADLAPHGIGASVLCPGLVNTNILACERNRPDRYGPPAEPDEAMLERARPEYAAEMDPAEVGETVLEGIRNDALYILTHPEWKPLVERRNRKLEAAFGTPDPAKVRSVLDALKRIQGD